MLVLIFKNYFLLFIFLSGICKNSITISRAIAFQPRLGSQKYSSYGKCNRFLSNSPVLTQNSINCKTNLALTNVCQRHQVKNLAKPIMFTRNVNFFSKKGKKKTVKSVTKRFKRMGSGALKRWRAGKNHNMRKKSHNQKRRLKKPVIVKGRQLRKLNQMISGW